MEVTFTVRSNGSTAVRKLLADTGAGSNHSSFHVLLSEEDSRLFGISRVAPVQLTGAFEGLFHSFHVIAAISALNVTWQAIAVGVPSSRIPLGFDGIACFRFLNSLDYGNFGNPDQFGLQTR